MTASWPRGVEALSQDLRNVHDTTWIVRGDEHDGRLTSLHGGTLPPPEGWSSPSGASTGSALGSTDIRSLAHAHVAAFAEALDVDPEDMHITRAVGLALSRAGASDKLVVELEQRRGGVAVTDGTLCLLFEAAGGLVALQSRTRANLASVDTTPDVPLAAARKVVWRFATEQLGRAPDSIVLDGLVVASVAVSESKRATHPALVWRFVIRAAHGPEPSMPWVRELLVSARGTPVILGVADPVRRWDITGTGAGNGQPNLLPDEPVVAWLLSEVLVTSDQAPAGVLTDDLGQWVLPGQAPADVTLSFDGGRCRVCDPATLGFDPPTGMLTCTPYAETTAVTSSPADLLYNAAPEEAQEAVVNAHVAVLDMLDWLEGVAANLLTACGSIPEVLVPDPVITVVNRPLGSCSESILGYWDGQSINFFAAAGSCPNTAYGTIIRHELGHWLNQLYGSGNSNFGFGEGAADAWAMYSADDSEIGAEFTGAQSVRSGVNTAQFCADHDGACLFDPLTTPHAKGLPLMGALWDVRVGLKAELGDVAGRQAADALFLAWFVAFNDGLLSELIGEHWLVLCDDDGDLSNGTPHGDAIRAGFGAHGMTLPEPPTFTLTHDLVDLVEHEGPVPFEATVLPLGAVATTAVDVETSTDGETWTTTPLAPSGPDAWTGVLPPAASPGVVLVRLIVTDSNAASHSWPLDDPLRYDVGFRRSLRFFDFEDLDDAGWTHADLQPLPVQDDWQHGEVFGKKGDPLGAWSGERVWGNDLGQGPWSGDVQPMVHSVLRSPPFDFSCESAARLRFRRWLTVEGAEHDRASIVVTWTDGGGGAQTVWANPDDSVLRDTHWVDVDVDLGVADGHADVIVEFHLETDGSVQLGGWTIDDVEFLTLETIPPMAFRSYGQGTPGTNGVPLLAGSGLPSPGHDITFVASGALPFAQPALFFIGVASTQLPFLGGELLVDQLIVPPVPVALDNTGGLAITATILDDCALVGFALYTQIWIADTNGPAGASSTNGLSLVIQ